MKIQVNSDKSIAGHAELTTFVEGEVSRILRRFAARLTRVEVHLSDVDSTKSGPADKRCLIEVRPAGGQPRIASAQASTVSGSVLGATAGLSLCSQAIPALLAST